MYPIQACVAVQIPHRGVHTVRLRHIPTHSNQTRASSVGRQVRAIFLRRQRVPGGYPGEGRIGSMFTTASWQAWGHGQPPELRDLSAEEIQELHHYRQALLLAQQRCYLCNERIGDGDATKPTLQDNPCRKCRQQLQTHQCKMLVNARTGTQYNNMAPRKSAQ